jgi:hypothetical protein
MPTKSAVCPPKTVPATKPVRSHTKPAKPTPALSEDTAEDARLAKAVEVLETRLRKPTQPTPAPSAPVPAPGPVLDVTTQDATVAITSGRTGQTITFTIHTQAPDASFVPGARIVSRLMNDGRSIAFAWANPDGLRVWKNFTDDKVYMKFADMLERPSKYIAMGCGYDVRDVRECE